MKEFAKQILMKAVLISMYLWIPLLFILSWIGISDSIVITIVVAINAFWMIGAAVLKRSFLDEDGYSAVKWSKFTINKYQAAKTFQDNHPVLVGLTCFVAAIVLGGWVISIQGPMNPTAKTFLLTVALAIGVILYCAILYVVIPLLIVYMIIKVSIWIAVSFRKARVEDFEKALRQSKEKIEGDKT